MNLYLEFKKNEIKKKALQRINTTEDVQKRESSHNLCGNVTGEATIANSMQFPWTLNIQVSHDATIPLLGLDLEKFIIEIHSAKWHVHPCFQASTIYNTKDVESTKMSTDRKMKTTWSIYTLEYYSAIKENEIRHWQLHGRTEKFSSQVKQAKEKKTNILRYHTQVESINSSQWTNVQNKNGLTDWENQILIIKR